MRKWRLIYTAPGMDFWRRCNYDKFWTRSGAEGTGGDRRVLQIAFRMAAVCTYRAVRVDSQEWENARA